MSPAVLDLRSHSNFLRPFTPWLYYTCQQVTTTPRNPSSFYFTLANWCCPDEPLRQFAFRPKHGSIDLISFKKPIWISTIILFHHDDFLWCSPWNHFILKASFYCFEYDSGLFFICPLVEKNRSIQRRQTYVFFFWSKPWSFMVLYRVLEGKAWTHLLLHGAHRVETMHNHFKSTPSRLSGLRTATEWG